MNAWRVGTIVGIAFLCSITLTSARACDPGILKFVVTDLHKTFIRKGNGEWAAPRPGDAPHGGVDIIVNSSYPDNGPYAVHPISAGTVAYSQINGSETKGYGNAIVIDHGSNCYSLYAHLANAPFTPMK